MGGVVRKELRTLGPRTPVLQIHPSLHLFTFWHKRQVQPWNPPFLQAALVPFIGVGFRNQDWDAQCAHAAWKLIP